MTRVGVIGGGLAGLVAADRLLDAGFEVTVLEKYPEAGGLVGVQDVGGTPLERFYHHLFTSDVDYVDLARELGMDRDIAWLPSRMGFFSGGSLYDFGTPASLLRFSPLSLRGKLAFVRSTLRLRGIRDWRALEGETAQGWLLSHGYSEVYEKVWGPLLFQKYGKLAAEVGLVWLWGKIALRSRSRDRTGLGERVGYLRGSFGRVVEALLARVKEKGGAVRTARPVRLLRGGGAGFSLEIPGGTVEADVVLSTVAIPELLRIAGDVLPPDVRTTWSAIRYCHALCPVLELDRPLTPYYWLNVAERTMPFGGMIEQTNLIAPAEYGGRHVVYLSNYVLPDDPKWTMRDADLWALYLPALRRVRPDFEESWILDRTINRGEYAQPIVGTGYSKVVPPVRTEVPGLYTASMAQIYPEDRGQNYAVRIGREAAEAIRGELATPARVSRSGSLRGK